MMKIIRKMRVNKIFLLIAAYITAFSSLACTSAIVSGKATASGRPILWKHRDTGAPQNFVAKIAPENGNHGFVAVFNDGDSLFTEAWMGMNDAGFAIMNTASYNLMPDTATVKDREGIVMKLALQTCVTLEDFEALLQSLPKPLGVQANFGVLDANGRGAYYETDDFAFTRFLVDDTEAGYIIRTNYSHSGDSVSGYGYIREANALALTADAAANRSFSPELFTEGLSRSFYHSLLDKDFMATGDTWAVDQDFIPRNISTASVAIEGMLPGEDASAMTMWTAIGYPPLSRIFAVTLDVVPEQLQPLLPGFTSEYGNAMLERKKEAFPIERGSGQHYVNLDAIRKYYAELRKQSAEEYARRREEMSR